VTFCIMRKSDYRMDLGFRRRNLHNPIFRASVLFLVVLSGSCKASSGRDLSKPTAASGPGLPFAIADFDGDLHPDFASVESGVNSSGNTNYRIQLQLSALGRQSIQLVAPAGGLFIEARDVNGDHAVDLVLATAWFRKPVAIFLNDGHGRFSRAEPTAFPGAFTQSDNWIPTAKLAVDGVGAPPQSAVGICANESNAQHSRSPAGLTLLPSPGFSARPFLVSQPGRAPPI
jgi:hypothetical protein